MKTFKEQFEEITNPKKYVRVIDSTYSDLKGAKAMIGGEFEVSSEYYRDNTVTVWNKDKSNSFVFNRSDLVFLTPIEFNGSKIGIGDTVNGGIVYDYDWYDGEYRLFIVRNQDFSNGCFRLSAGNIISHTPILPKQSTDLSQIPNDIIVEEMRKRGLLESKEVVK